MSRYQRLIQQSQGAAGQTRARAEQPPQPAAGYAAAPGAGRATPNAVDSKYVEDIPSDDDIAIEESGVVGRAAIERLLNGRLIEERNHDGTPVG